MQTNEMKQTNNTPERGEGDRQADRNYRTNAHHFAKNGDVTGQAKAAKEAYEGKDGDTLREAERRAKNGPTGDGVFDELYMKVSTMRDELRLEVNLAQMEARDKWVELERAWYDVQSKAVEMARHSSEEMTSAAYATLERLRESYERMKRDKS